MVKDNQESMFQKNENVQWNITFENQRNIIQKIKWFY